MLRLTFLLLICALLLTTKHVKTLLAEKMSQSQPLQDDQPTYLEKTPETYLNLHSPPLTKHSVSLLKAYLNLYGLGSCGPRGFLGTFSSHIHLELALEKHYNMPAILYSSYASVAQSAIMSAGCNYVFLSTNASYELKRCLECCDGELVDFSSLSYDKMQNKQGAWLLIDSHEILSNRIIENDIKSLSAAAEKLHIRTLLVDTLFPVSCQWDYRYHFDLVIGSLEASFGLPGGFCCGCRVLVENQRTGGLGYCFSAAAPPALVGLAVERMHLKNYSAVCRNSRALGENGWKCHGFYCEKDGHVVTVNEWLTHEETLQLANNELKYVAETQE